MEKITNKGKLVALKISSISDGSVPVMAPGEPLQVLTLKHPKGRVVAPHLHIPHNRETDALQECLVVVSGKLKVSFFDDKKEPFASINVSKGEACIILFGPHGVEFLEDSEVFEIKNGPFFDDKKPFVAAE